MASTAGLAQLLTDTLSFDGNVRISAELKLNQALGHPETGLSLSQLIIAGDVDIHLRQISFSRRVPIGRVFDGFSSPLARREHPAAQVREGAVVAVLFDFKGTAAPPEVKGPIREAVFRGLSDPVRKIRSLSAQTLSLIANCDWPDEYPDLLTALINLLSTDDPSSVHGALQVFTEFVKADLSEDQILPVLRELLPVLLAILGDHERHSPLTRARTIAVFRQCISALYMVKEMHPQAIKEATASVLPVWLEAFKVLLNLDPRQDVENSENWDGLAIRIQVYRALDTIHTTFPRALKPYLDDYLSASLQHLDSYFPAYFKHYVAADDPAPKSSEDDSIEIPEVICPILDFVTAIARSGRAKEWFTDARMNALISAVFVWAQMSTETEESWSNSSNAFISEEADSAEAYTIRVAGFDLLEELLQRAPLATTATFNVTIQHTVAKSSQDRAAGNTDWWRPLEAALAALGSQAESVLDCISDEEDSGRSKPINIEQLLSDVIPSLLLLSECPFLQGRAFVFASQYARLLPSELGTRYIEAALQVIEDANAGVPIKVSAIKAIQNFTQKMEGDVLNAFAPRIVKDLGPFMLLTSDDTLQLVLETLSVCVEIDSGRWLTADLTNSLTVAILEVWTKTNKDPMFTSVLSDLLGFLAKSENPGVYSTVVREALPSLCNSIAAAPKEQSWVAETAIELISALMEGAPETGLGEGFFAILAPSLFPCLMTAEDRDILQNAAICLTLVVRKDCAQLLAWSDPAGLTGLNHTFQFIAKLLESKEESAGLFIGDLVIHLLRKAGDAVSPILPELLQAMVTRMLTAQTATFIQGLLLPFTYLVYKEAESILSLLESITVDGRSGLDIFIQTWCENPVFQGEWQSNISTLALCHLYTFERPSLQNLHVKGDIIINPATKDVIMTRSKTKQTPHKFTSVPFPVKALKLIVSDLQDEGASVPPSRTAADLDSDDDDEDWTEEEKLHGGFSADEHAALSEMLGPRGINFDNDDGPSPGDDDAFKDDPVYLMDMRAHLATFFKECAARNTNNFSAVVDQLSAEEMLVVRHAIGQ